MNKKLLYILLAGLILTACEDNDTSSSDIKKYDTVMLVGFATAEQIQDAKSKGIEIPKFIMPLEKPTADQLENIVTPKSIKSYEGMYKSFYEDFDVCSATIDKRESVFVMPKENQSDDECSKASIGNYNGHNYVIFSRYNDDGDKIVIDTYDGLNLGNSKMMSSYANNDNPVVSNSRFHIEGIKTPVEFINKQTHVITYKTQDERSCNAKGCKPFDTTVDFGTKKIKLQLFNGYGTVTATIKGNIFVGETMDSNSYYNVIGGFYGKNASSIAYIVTKTSIGLGRNNVTSYGLADKVNNSSNN